MRKCISSKDNQQLKYYSSLHDSRKAAKADLAYIEGVRLCEDCLSSGVKPSVVFFTARMKDCLDKWIELYSLDDSIDFFELTEECFSKLASTVNPQGISMFIKKSDCNVQSVNSEKKLPVRDGKNIYVVLENLQDPGNLGTILRMADAFDFTAVLMTKDSVDPFNEKVLRASMGSLWHIPVRIFENSDEICDILEKENVHKYAAHLHGKPLNNNHFLFPAAYFIGNEGRGLTDRVSDRCEFKIKIPMPGKAESLNAASAASIIGYLLSAQD